MLRNFLRSVFAEKLVVGYLRLVRRTTRVFTFPPEAHSAYDASLPAIVATWHGKSFMAPFIRRPADRCILMVSKSRDGEFYARIAKALRLDVVRGSTATSKKDVITKDGLGASWQMLDALGSGSSVAMTVNEPRRAFVVGEGVIRLARLSGRPIVPLAVTTTLKIVVGSWDRTEISLPFGRLVFVIGTPIYVEPSADRAERERIKQQLKDELDLAHQRATHISKLTWFGLVRRGPVR
jgi:lysophospholipid acyltransferase (LPLAT)-like uncharacterized protein